MEIWICCITMNSTDQKYETNDKFRDIDWLRSD